MTDRLHKIALNVYNSFTLFYCLTFIALTLLSLGNVLRYDSRLPETEARLIITTISLFTAITAAASINRVRAKYVFIAYASIPAIFLCSFCFEVAIVFFVDVVACQSIESFWYIFLLVQIPVIMTMRRLIQSLPKSIVRSRN